MILNASTRSMLRLLQASKPDRTRGAFSYDRIREISGLDETEMFRALKDLVAHGLAEYAYAASGDKKRDAGIALTQRGFYFDEMNRLERRERWKERALGFFSGIATSVLAGVILSLLVG